MKIDFSQNILGLDGKPFRLTDEDGSPFATLKDVAITALSLLTPAERERGISATDQARRYALMVRIYDAPAEIDLPAEDISLIKSLVPVAYPSPRFGGPALKLLDG